MAKHSIPNIFTFGNLTCGILSLLMTFEGNYMWACIFILIAGLMDRYDGKIARFLDVSSELGKELDSLADLVSFGVAPALLMFNLNGFIALGIIGYLIVIIFTLSGAYRLARYNSTAFNSVYLGVPITIAGTLVAFYSLLTIKHAVNLALPIGILLSLSYLMISKLQIKKV